MNLIKKVQAILPIGAFFFISLLAIPLSLVLAHQHAPAWMLFLSIILGLIPIARIMGYATHQFALQTNPTMSGLVSATFGNSIELIIALVALSHGLIRVVQASIIGTILGNILLLAGLSIFFGGLKHKHQNFNKETIGVSSTMLIIVVAGLVIPSVMFYTTKHNIPALSDAVAIVLAIIYLAGLIFTLKTHKDLFDAVDNMKSAHEKIIISKYTAAGILFISTIVVALLSKTLVTTLETAGTQLGISQTFIGIVIIAIVTNIAENAAAVHFARQNKLNLSLEIGLSSAIQIALFVVPILVFASQIFGYGFSLVFSIFEVITVFLAVMVVNHLAADGKCNWLEGAQLISIYLIIVIAFYFI